MIFEAEKVSTQIKDRSDWDISEWLEKNKVTELPLGFTNFKDGNIPLDRKQVVKPEAERNAKLERINQEARQSKAVVKRQKEADRIKRQKEMEARKIERAIAKLERDAAKKEQAAIKAELKALGQTQVQVDRAARINRQMLLLAEFRSKAQLGDIQAMSRMLGFKKDIMSKLVVGGVALSVKRLALLEEILPTFEYGTHINRSKVMAREISPKRQIWIRNHEAKNAALAKGHRKFIGFCHKENKETIFRIYATRDVSACVSCGKASQKRKRELTAKKPREVSENRKRMLEAQAQNLKSFIGVCKHHGETSFRIHDINSFKCKLCAAEAMQKTRLRTRSELESNPRTIELREFLRSDEKNGRVSALARFLGVSITTVSNYGLGNAAIPDQQWEKIKEFKAQLQGVAA